MRWRCLRTKRKSPRRTPGSSSGGARDLARLRPLAPPSGALSGRSGSGMAPCCRGASVPGAVRRVAAVAARVRGAALHAARACCSRLRTPRSLPPCIGTSHAAAAAASAAALLPAPLAAGAPAPPHRCCPSPPTPTLTVPRPLLRPSPSSFFEEKGLVGQQLDSFNEFVSNTIQEVVDEAPEIIVRPNEQHYGGDEGGEELQVRWRMFFTWWGDVSAGGPCAACSSATAATRGARRSAGVQRFFAAVSWQQTRQRQPGNRFDLAGHGRPSAQPTLCATNRTRSTASSLARSSCPSRC